MEVGFAKILQSISFVPLFPSALLRISLDCLAHHIVINSTFLLGLPGGSDGKESACSAGDPGLISGLGRSCGEGNDNPLQYSYLENCRDRGAGGL